VTIVSLVTTLVLAAGLFFVAVTAVGMRRLPDVFCRLHVLGVIDTLGVPLILLAAAIYVGPTLAAFKLVLALVFIAITSPIIGQLLARAAVEAGRKPGLLESPVEYPPAPEPAGGCAGTPETGSSR
jgi:multicomponent Na+:H+ antiporter subunit G